MPTPHGRDRLAELEDGSVALSSLRPKGWTGRVEANGAVTASGTAVEWDESVWEVLRVEALSSGGTRYVLAPWDERLLIRSLVRYPEDAPPAPPPSAPSSPSAAAATATAAAGRSAASSLAAAWKRLPGHLRVLVLGFVPGVALGGIFPFHLMGEGMSFLVHELGHTAVSILFGSLAVPAVILTITFEQSRLAAGMIWAGLAWVAWKAWDSRWPGGLLAGAVLAAVLYPFLAFSTLHVDAILAGGHLAEAVVAALFFLRAVGSPTFAAWERPVYSFFAWYLWRRSTWLFWGVATDAQARTDYLTVAIAGENDLVRIASRHGVGLEPLAFAAFVVVALVPAAGLVLGLRAARSRSAG